MPKKSDPDALAIEAAYRDHVQTLFKVLISNIIDAPGSHQTEQQCLEKFRAGLKVARRAKTLALSGMAAAPTAGA